MSTSAPRPEALASGAPAVPMEEGSTLFAERHRMERLGRIRQLVFGSLDGLLVPLGVISGVAGGTGDTKSVIIAGIAEAFAGALSMGAGEFIAARSEAQVQQREVQQELAEIRSAPGFELHEMARLFQHEGVAAHDALLLATTLAKYPDCYAKTMVEKELAIPFEPEVVRVPEAITMGASYIVGSIFPLIAYFFFPVPVALPISLLLTLVALVIVGTIKGKLAQLQMARSVLEVVVVGALSAGGGWLLGNVIPHLFGY